MRHYCAIWEEIVETCFVGEQIFQIMPTNNGIIYFLCYNEYTNTSRMLISGGKAGLLLSIQSSFQKEALKDIKKLVAKKRYTFVERDKNVQFMREHQLDSIDIREIILDLSPTNCVGGPEQDKDGPPGYILKYKSMYLMDTVIYIKIRYNPPSEVVIISFHEDEPK